MAWQILLSVFSTVFLSPFANALEPLTLPLPQSTDYATYMRSQLLHANFSTDPREARPEVAAAGSALQAFIINYEPCGVFGDAVAYRAVVRNMSKEPLAGVIAQFIYPVDMLQFKEATASPAATVTHQPETVEWTIDTLLPGPENWQELNLTFVVVDPDGGGLATTLKVTSGAGVVITGHTTPNNCGTAPAFAEKPLPGKNPAIVCDPGELGCVPSVPTLGKLFNQVVNDPARQPTICSEIDPDGCVVKFPDLGPRFTEATASLLPGECSVLEDAVLAEPLFQNGLLRRGDVAAPFMQPLYNSGQDFSRLVLENEMLGIKNKLQAKEILRTIHTKHWQQRVEPLQNVLRGASSTNTIRGQLAQWETAWSNETREAQKDLQQRYEVMQAEREKKFDPVAEQASTNAITSIGQACGGQLFPPREPDDGLRRLLLNPPTGVKQAYTEVLQTRSREYTRTQELFADPDNPFFPADSQAVTWQRELREALDAFDAGNKQLLEQFIAQIPAKDQAGFNVSWRLTYEQHATADVAADDNVRLNRFETALDVPKTTAAACTRDTTLAARVEVSWCESGLYPSNYIIQDAPVPIKAREVAPPQLIGGGEEARVDVQRTVGVSCGGRPGDPFWAADCSCSCNQLVPGRDGNILFCQVGKGVVDQSQLDPDSDIGAIKPIIRDDIYAIAQGLRTQDECLNERTFDDHFLVNYP